MPSTSSQPSVREAIKLILQGYESARADGSDALASDIRASFRRIVAALKEQLGTSSDAIGIGLNFEDTEPLGDWPAIGIEHDVTWPGPDADSDLGSYVQFEPEAQRIAIGFGFSEPPGETDEETRAWVAQRIGLVRPYAQHLGAKGFAILGDMGPLEAEMRTDGWIALKHCSVAELPDDATLVREIALLHDTYLQCRQEAARHAKRQESSRPRSMGALVTAAGEILSRPERLDDEVPYKREIGERLQLARQAALSGGDWPGALQAALKKNNLIYHGQARTIRAWLEKDGRTALRALRTLWAGEGKPADRIAAFLKAVPKSAVSNPSGRLDFASMLLMGEDCENLPHVRQTVFRDAFELAGLQPPPRSVNEADFYTRALDFLDEFIRAAQHEGVSVNNRLEAESVIWCIVHEEGTNWLDDPANLDLPVVPGVSTAIPAKIPERTAHAGTEALATLADRLCLDVAFLTTVDRLLRDRRQVIFYGPPGTGKTYVARELARFYAGAPERAKVVQFHPSYAYEDFIEGYRPRSSGDGGFELVAGPLKELAAKAAAAPQVPHVLVIDEINRGNVARVFGELYYLLEYRGEHIGLQYSRVDFALPDNLYVIGTMNSADRSIALLDGALRRRFHFVEFSPHSAPVADVLRRWLGRHQPGMRYVAQLVAEANRRLQSHRAAIGPSYFMRAQKDLDESWLELIWKHQIMPYLEEEAYGNPDLLRGLELSVLREAVGQGDRAESGAVLE